MSETMHLEPQTEYDLHEFRNNQTLRRANPVVTRLAGIVSGSWDRVRELAAALSKAWAHIHSQDARIAELERQVAELKAAQTPRLHEERAA